MTVVMALGGSTNAVLHLLAIARACHVTLTLDDFQVSGRELLPVSCQCRNPQLDQSVPQSLGACQVLLFDGPHLGPAGSCLPPPQPPPPRQGQDLKENLCSGCRAIQIIMSVILGLHARCQPCLAGRTGSAEDDSAFREGDYIGIKPSRLWHGSEPCVKMLCQANSDRVPFIADLKPSGKYVMEDLHKVRSRKSEAAADPPLSGPYFCSLCSCKRRFPTSPAWQWLSATFSFLEHAPCGAPGGFIFLALSQAGSCFLHQGAVLDTS
jgi:hypothetical protein